MTKGILVAGLVTLLALVLLGLPLVLLSWWVAIPVLGLHVATLWQLLTPGRQAAGLALGRITGVVGAGVVLVVYLLFLPSLAHFESRGLMIALAPAFVAHAALALVATGAGAERGRRRRHAWLGLATVGAIALGVVAWVVVFPPGHSDLRVHGNAIYHVRTMISAQDAYAYSNGGFYDTPRCLESPADCIPGYPEDAPIFITPEVVGTEDAYRRSFHSGPPAEAEGELRGRTSPSSLRSYAFVVAPTIPGETADRAYCADSTGVIRFSEDGSMPEIQDGRCPEDLPVLQ
jgi:hypothetical protein